MASPLSDLDELVLSCRDDKAKAYLSEAVASYKAGAFRAAIVGTWIAVCFDFIDKLRELSLSGDKEADRQVEELEKTRKSGDIAKALKFEKEMLGLARDKFELISHLEYIDLERLQADRNRCAHPSLVSEEQAYLPSAELARAHIHAAVTHLLQHPPAQGKYALDRLLKEIDSEFFPIDPAKAVTAFTSGPLRKPRNSLTRNFTLLLVKRLLKEDIQFKPRQRIVAALRAVGTMHPSDYNITLEEKLSPIMRTLEDVELIRATQFIERIPDCWQFIDVDVRHRLEGFVREFPADQLDDLEFLLKFSPLRGSAESRVQSASRDELTGLIYFDLPVKIADRLIDLYLDSKNFDQANDMGKQLLFNASDLSANHVQRIITQAQKNDQVLYSFELGSLLNSLRARKKLPEEQFDSLLRENGLSKYAPAPHQPA